MCTLFTLLALDRVLQAFDCFGFRMFSCVRSVCKAGNARVRRTGAGFGSGAAAVSTGPASGPLCRARRNRGTRS